MSICVVVKLSQCPACPRSEHLYSVHSCAYSQWGENNTDIYRHTDTRYVYTEDRHDLLRHACKQIRKHDFLTVPFTHKSLSLRSGAARAALCKALTGLPSAGTDIKGAEQSAGYPVGNVRWSLQMENPEEGSITYGESSPGTPDTTVTRAKV